MTYHVSAKITAAEGKEGEVYDILVALLSPSRAEPGCLAYHMARDVEDPRVFWFSEDWADGEAFKAHTESTHFGKAVSALEGLLAAAPEIKGYVPVES